jgi:proline iminopeptidase
VHAEWQDLAVGEYLKYWRRNGPVDAWQVAAFEPNRFLALRGIWDLRQGRVLDPTQPRPSAYMEGLWAFLLTELEGGHTRLVISGYQAMRPRWLERLFNYWLYMPVTWPMQVRMLAVLKRNIERAAAQPPVDGRPASWNALPGRDPGQLHTGASRWLANHG